MYRTRADEILIRYEELSNMSTELKKIDLNNDLFIKREDELLGKLKEYFDVDLRLTVDEIRKLGYLFEQIDKTLKILLILVEDADTDEEKLKWFVMNDLFLEILDDGLKSRIKKWERNIEQRR